MSKQRVLLIFVDGLGLAPASDFNPLVTVPTPALQRLLGGALTLETCQRLEDGEQEAPVLVPLDAQLGVEGLPQSATGQTALFTGINAPEQMGHHVSAFPGPQLRGLINKHGLLRRARKAGLEVTFANAYSEGYFERVASRRGRHSATTLTALAAGLRLRSVEELLEGAAVAWDVTRHRFGASAMQPVPAITPAEAGRHLAAIASRHDLTLWETFLSDLAGHRRFDATAEEALERIDGLLEGLLSHRPPDLTVALTSDHGNLEDARHKRHTENPVPLLVVGPAGGRFRGLRDLTEVTPKILEILGVEV